MGRMIGERKVSTQDFRILIDIFFLGNILLMGIGTASGTAVTQSQQPTISPASLSDNSIVSDCELSGQIEVGTATGKMGEVRMEVPISHTSLAPPDQTAAEFANVTKLLNLSDTQQDTVVGIVPAWEVDRNAAGWADRGGDNVCLKGIERYIWDGLMTHEYVHNRQEFTTASDMEWFIESSAFYYMALVPYQRGTMSEKNAIQRLSEPTREDNSSNIKNLTLTRSDQRWVEQARGVPVLAALDHEIRNRTNGERTLEHVIQRMNDEHQDISYSDFRDIVADVADERMDSWLNRYVTTSEAISPNQSQVTGLTLTSSDAYSNYQIHEVDSPFAESTGTDPDSLEMDITEGTEGSITAFIVNNGTVRDRQNLRLLVNGTGTEEMQVANQNGSIAPDQGTNITFNVSLFRSLDPGTYELILATQDDEVRGALTVNAKETPAVSTETDRQDHNPVNPENSADGPSGQSGQSQTPLSFVIQKWWVFPSVVLFVGIYLTYSVYRHLS